MTAADYLALAAGAREATLLTQGITDQVRLRGLTNKAKEPYTWPSMSTGNTTTT